MTGDEIVFDDVRYREPVRACRPDRDARYACLDYGVPGPADLPIFMDRRAADAIERHALSDTGVELGGVVLGKECIDPETGDPFVWVTTSLEAKHYANTQASFTYTHASWEEITRERERIYPDLEIVGWYHTHPGFGIFLSHHDLFIHQNFFSQRLQVAYVVDPINQSRGFFQWRGGSMMQLGGFTIVGERSERLGLARFVNDLENVPNPEGSVAGALSPRLEAEMIRMLNRSTDSYQSANPLERAQAAILYTMAGGFLGILLVALVFWLFQITDKLQKQGDAIAVMTETVGEVSNRQRVALDLLGDPTKSSATAEFIDRHAKLLREKDDLAKKLESQATINQALAASSKVLETRLTKDLEATIEKLAAKEKEAQEIPKLREQLARLEEATRMRQGDDAASEVGDESSTPNSKQGSTPARYYEFLGWLLACLFAITTIVAWLYRGSGKSTDNAAEGFRASRIA